jgi:lipopolysaccharide transport system permease protein
MGMLANIITIAEYRSYIFYKAWSDLRAEARQYCISYIWWILSPLLDMLVYYLIFGIVLKGFKTENFMTFLLIGVITWNWLETSSLHCTKSIYKNRGVLKQVYLPKTILPLIDICTDTFKFMFAFSVFIIIINISGFFVSDAYLALPVVILTQLMVIICVGMLFSAITPFFQDFERFAIYGIRILFFMSGVFFDISQISQKYNFLFQLNPIAKIIDAYRDILMRSHVPDLLPLLIISLISACVILIITAKINKLDKIYPKVLVQ